MKERNAQNGTRMIWEVDKSGEFISFFLAKLFFLYIGAL